MSNEQKRRCFTCDGTGAICDVCGESEAACGCPEEEKSPNDCQDCKGTGIAAADLESDQPST